MRGDECKIMYREYQGWSFTCEGGCKIMYKEYQGWSFTCEGG